MSEVPTTRPQRILRRATLSLLGLAALAVVTSGAVYGVTEYRLHAVYDVPARPVALLADSAAVARGTHVVAIRGCADCHGTDFGGKVFIDDPAIGYVVSANLTRGRGGVGATYRAEDWDRAVRHGVNPAGRGLIMMPSGEYAALTDADLAAAVAYLRSLPPTDRVPESSRVGPVARALWTAGKLPLLHVRQIDHAAVPPATLVPAPTAAYGRYLATTCTGCHGATLAGGPIPGMPPGTPQAANLTPSAGAGLGRWTDTDFAHLLATGERPDGTFVVPPMPISVTAHLTDTEVHALWSYLRTVAPVATPVPRTGA